MPGSDLLSHGNPHTIIGAKHFHFRVRDGIGWYLLAMATRQTGYGNAPSLNSKNKKRNPQKT